MVGIDINLQTDEKEQADGQHEGLAGGDEADGESVAEVLVVVVVAVAGSAHKGIALADAKRKVCADFGAWSGRFAQGRGKSVWADADGDGEAGREEGRKEDVAACDAEGAELSAAGLSGFFWAEVKMSFGFVKGLSGIVIKWLLAKDVAKRRKLWLCGFISSQEFSLFFPAGGGEASASTTWIPSETSIFRKMTDFAKPFTAKRCYLSERNHDMRVWKF